MSYLTDESPGFDAIIRKIVDNSDEMTTVMGRAGLGVNPDGARASLGNPDLSCGVAVDHHGNVLFSERATNRAAATGIVNRIRVVAQKSGTFYGQPMAAGRVYSIAGIGVPGYSGDGGPATGAQLDDPGALSVDQAGNVLVADTANSAVRVIAEATGTFYGVPMTAGDIYTVAGGAGGSDPATRASLRFISAIKIDHSGNLLIADRDDHVVWAVPTTGGTYYGRAMKAGGIYRIVGVPPKDGNARCQPVGSGGTWLQARLCITGIAVDRAGNLVIVGNQLAWVAAVTNGTFYGRAMKARRIYQIVGPNHIGEVIAASVDGHGNALLVGPSSFGHPPGALYLLAAHSGRDFARKIQAGDVYRVGGDRSYNSSGDGGPARSAQFGGPLFDSQPIGGLPSIATDAHGNIVIADPVNSQLRVIAASTGRFYGQRMVKGDIYTIAGLATFKIVRTAIRRDTGPALGAVIEPNGVITDKHGDIAVSGPVGHQGLLWLYAGSSGTRFNRHLVSGHIYVLLRCPGKTPCQDPAQAAFDRNGNIVLSSPFLVKQKPQGNLVVIAAHNGTFYGRPMLAGHQYTLASDTGDDSVAIDRHGNVVMVHSSTVSVWPVKSGTFYGHVMQAHHLTTIGTGSFQADADAARLAIDSRGNIIVSAPDQAAVRVIAAATGTFYGVSMTAGGEYPIAGNGVHSFRGDGNPALGAGLYAPTGLALTPSGDLLIADFFRIRSVSH